MPKAKKKEVKEVKQAKSELLAEKLEYHLARLPGNSLTKQEIRAIFAALFR